MTLFYELHTHKKYLWRRFVYTKGPNNQVPHSFNWRPLVHYFAQDYTEYETSHYKSYVRSRYLPCLSFRVNQQMYNIRDMHCGSLYGRVNFESWRGGS